MVSGINLRFLVYESGRKYPHKQYNIPCQYLSWSPPRKRLFYRMKRDFRAQKWAGGHRATVNKKPANNRGPFAFVREINTTARCALMRLHSKARMARKHWRNYNKKPAWGGFSVLRVGITSYS